MDWYLITYIGALLAAAVSMFAQARVRSTYNKFSAYDNKNGITGVETARKLLESAGVYDMKIEETEGVLSDHYDPQTETLFLSRGVHSSKSLSAVGIAAHEAAHAIQHYEGYAPLAARQNFVRFANIGSKLSMPIVGIGLLLMIYETFFDMGYLLINAGLILFTAVVILQLITLPVEFNASSRALAMLESQEILTEEEMHGADKVLSAAAWTYIAATIAAVLTLIRLLLIAKGRRR